MQRECFCNVVGPPKPWGGRTWVALVVALVPLCSAGLARADVVPLPPVMEPAKEGEIISLFHKALADGLKQGGAKIVAPATVLSKLKLPPQNAGCAQPSCLGPAMTVFGGNQRFGAAHIKTIGKNYQITVLLFSGKKKIGAAAGRCDICTLSEALKKTKKLATDVGSKAEEPPAAGGTTAKKPPPKTVKKPSATTGTKTAKATPKATTGAGTGTATGNGSGSGSSTTTTETDTGRRWPLWPALVSAGVGVVGLVVGIPLLAIDGNYTNCTGTAAPDGSNCADIYSTSGGGWLMTGLGIAGIAASGVLFYLYFRSKGQKSEKAAALIGSDELGLTNVGVMPTSSGVVFGASGRF
ncbi:MAG: hypothetical protein KC503_14745 [Myxococcales bacterium]|nr:hypothetical protein [Myxococcales bacterium]